MTPTPKREDREALENRKGKLASRIADRDERERSYASRWLNILWLLHERSEP